MITTAQNTSTISPKIKISNGMHYDNPFLDMTSFYMPKTIKELFRYVNAVVYSDPIASQCISKLSEYPITKIIYNDNSGSVDSNKVEKRWSTILEGSMNIDGAMKECGMDYYAYGTSIVSINYPFKRMLECPKCKSKQSVDSKKAKYRDGKYISECKECGAKGEMKPSDMPTKEVDKLGYIFWDIMNIHIKYNNLSGEHFFYYTIPQNIKKAVGRGDLDIVNNTRIEIIEAVRKSKKLKLSKSNLFHYKRPGPQLLNPEQRGWGISAIMPVMKDIFYKRVLRKGNEAIAFEHIVPLRIIFPQGTGDVSPHSMINLGEWKSQIEGEILAWKRDPNRVSILPMPVGHMNFGGDGKMLLVTQEIKQVDADIITGIGIVPEIIQGGASWSGSNVSLRIVENTFLNHRKSMKEFIKWTVKGVSRYFNLAEIDVDMEAFKMADDLQRKQMMMQAAASDQISFDTALKELGVNPDDEYEKMIDEVKRMTEILTLKAEGQAEAQGAGQIISQIYGADAEYEAQARSEKRQREQTKKDDDRHTAEIEERAQYTTEEVAQVAESQGVKPNMISTQDFILVMTQRFARLAKHDPEDFKIRMLSMKNSTPTLYQEVYDNLKEMNVIAADTNPDLAMAQKYTPGEIPSYSQGDTTSETESNPVESGASIGSANPVTSPKTRPLPVSQPPSGANASV